MNMSKVIGGKRDAVVAQLVAEISAGRLSRGDQLEGENALARRFAVSRGTIRHALEELKRRELITTLTGVGSFVTFDGRHLDQRVGWARALADGGATLTTEVVDILPSTMVDPEAPDVGEFDAVAVRRIRRTADGRGVTHELSTVPATGPLADLPATGLIDGSLTASLAAAGLVAHAGTQEVSLARLDVAVAALLGREPGEPFLRIVRTSRSAEGAFVEHVDSLLDPDHFRLSLTFRSTP